MVYRAPSLLPCSLFSLSSALPERAKLPGLRRHELWAARGVHPDWREDGGAGLFPEAFSKNLTQSGTLVYQVPFGNPNMGTVISKFRSHQRTSVCVASEGTDLLEPI